VVFCAYVTARARTLFNFRLCLPKQWCSDRERRDRAQVPGDAVFATKTEQGTEMVTEAVAGGVPFAWLAGDEVYGRSSKLRAACEDAGKGYVFAVPASFTVTTPAGRKTTAALARLVPARCWETRSCGQGCKGHRDYEWAWVATSSARHWLLIRRKICDPADMAFFYCHAPGTVSLPILIKVAGKRWPVEECHQQGKGQTGLDQHQLRLWHSFHRHTVLSMCALALLAVATARHPAPLHPGPLPVRTQPAGRRPAPAPALPNSRNTGATPAPSRPAPARTHPATSG
jgi:SRSO17 transposase